MDTDQEAINEKREKHDAEYKKQLQLRQSLGRREYNFVLKTIKPNRAKEEEVHHEGPSLSIVLKGAWNREIICLFQYHTHINPRHKYNPESSAVEGWYNVWYYIILWTFCYFEW